MGRPMPRHDVAFLIRVVATLLIARVVAAPIALNPAAPSDPLRAGLILRVCTWPAQEGRPTATKLTIGEWSAAPTEELIQDLSFPTEAGSASRIHPSDPRERYTRRALDRLLC